MPDGMRGKPCTLCEAPDARICERCKSARYCSVDCQSDDWKVHKLLCKSFSKFDMSERPSEDYFRAIVFPENVSKPELVWIYCQWLDQPGLEWQEPNAAPFLCDWGTPAGILVETDAILQRNLPNPIVIYTQNERLEGSSSTRSVSAVVATIPGYHNGWRGPIVAVGKKMHNGQPIACRDLDMEDFRYIADFLIAHRRWSRDVPGPTTDFVKGVRMNCDSDCKVFNKPRFEPVDVPSTDPIFGVSCEPESELQWNDTSDIADRIGLSLLTRRLPPSLRRARLAYGDFQNQDATQLHLCCDPTANGLPTGYGSSPGFEAICEYIRHDAGPPIFAIMGPDRDPSISRESVLSMITGSNFSKYWGKFLEEKRKEGTVVEEPSPYNV
ncbi:hypothetical protein E8E14_009708 [Neopestalotiopsis sp. 37M]|nr:hypothetical protein E8E14_009708 [Neopestalotiopsis sp. 37M]